MEAEQAIAGELTPAAWRIVERLMTPMELMCLLNARAAAADLPLWTLEDCTRQLAVRPITIMVRTAA